MEKALSSGLPLISRFSVLLAPYPSCRMKNPHPRHSIFIEPCAAIPIVFLFFDRQLLFKRLFAL
jgi:hypothetical protein